MQVYQCNAPFACNYTGRKEALSAYQTTLLEDPTL